MLALAHHRLGHAEEARRWLDKALDQHKTVKERLRSDAAGFGLAPEWADFEIRFSEAATAYGGYFYVR